jgi:uncharacterized protein (DUF885 family)
LPKVDPASQEMRLHYWQAVLKQVDAIPRASLSHDEQINYDVYRFDYDDFAGVDGAAASVTNG